MSLWSVLGGVGKVVGKVALGTVGKVTGVSGLPTIFDHKPSASSPVPTAATQSLQSTTFDPNGQAVLNAGVTIGSSPSTQGLPSWLIPAGIAAVLVLLITNRK